MLRGILRLVALRTVIEGENMVIQPANSHEIFGLTFYQFNYIRGRRRSKIG